MRKIVEYNTIANTFNLGSLVLDVRKAMLDGWQPWGAQYFADGSYIQPMVRYEEQELTLPAIFEDRNMTVRETIDALSIKYNRKDL